MPSEIFYSQASQCVVLDTPTGRRHYFDPMKGGGEWKNLLNILKMCEDRVPTDDKHVNMEEVHAFLTASRQEQAELLRAAGRKVTTYKENGKKKLSLEELGL